MKKIKSFTSATGILLAVSCWGAANATTFNLANVPGNSWTQNGITLTANAWSVINGNPERSTLGKYSTGLGVTNRLDGNGDSYAHWHSIDNYKGNDYVKLDFSSDVKIEEIVLEIWRQDGDMTLGFGDNWNDNLQNIDWNGSNTWTIDLSGNSSLNFDDEWRIFAQLGSGCTNRCDSINDGFKLQSITVSQVPIPGAIWLFGSALVGVVGVGYRRRGLS